MNPYYEKYMQGNLSSALSSSPYAYWSLYADEKEKTKDQKRLQELYPWLAGQIQPLVIRECDGMEYEGSYMFDEYPDKLMLGRIVGRIYERLDKERLAEKLMLQCEDSHEMWIRQLITVMLLDEMFRRRCRRRERKRYY